LETFVHTEEEQSISLAIHSAQEKALELSGKETVFVQNYSIDISVAAKDVPNITMVDLPGFTNSSDADSTAVRDIVKKYVEMKGSLVLHIVRADVDFDAALGNDFLRPFSDKTTLVFTYCDELEGQGLQKANTRYEATLKATSQPRFAVLAEHPLTAAKEREALRALSSLKYLDENLDFQLGVERLNHHLENCLVLHFETRLPLAVETLRESLEKVQARVDIVRHQAPVDQWTRALRIVETGYHGSNS